MLVVKRESRCVSERHRSCSQQIQVFPTQLRRRQKVESRERNSKATIEFDLWTSATTHTALTMLLPRIRALPTGSVPAIATVETALKAFRLSTPALNTTNIGVRHASHKAQGAANSAKDGAGKRLGAKKSGGM
jgi:hypothetical protein